MNLAKRIVIGTLIAGWAWLALVGNAIAEGNTEGTTSKGWVTKGDWQQRVLQHRATTQSGPEQARVDQQRIMQWSPSRQNRVRTASTSSTVSTAPTASTTFLAEPEEIAPGEAQSGLTPLPADEAYESVDMGGPDIYPPGSEFGNCGPGGDCAQGSGCQEGCGAHLGCCGFGIAGLRQKWWARDLSLFAGAHAFKGPFDRGLNGNFGLHEGLNFGAPLGGPWGWGYQVGFAAVHSNFAGNRATGQFRLGDRDQLFFTTGIFHRALSGGIQWGVTFDLLRDTYYANADMKQIRTEIGYVLRQDQQTTSGDIRGNYPEFKAISLVILVLFQDKVIKRLDPLFPK